jgi:predicted amidohydrolase
MGLLSENTFMRYIVSLCLVAWAVSTGEQTSAASGRREIRVAGAQIAVTGDVNANLAALERAVQYAAAQKADILLTPEGSLSGIVTDFDAKRTAAALERITAVARKSSVALALGTCFLEPDDDRKYDEVRFYSPKGDYLGFHSKVLLCSRVAKPSPDDEINHFSTRPLRTFQVKGMTVGALICNDLWANPEFTPQADTHLSQKLSEQGARIIFHAVNSGLASGEVLEMNRHFHDANLRMRARAGKVWIVTVDAASSKPGLSNQAPSGVIDPSGHWAVRVNTSKERFFVYTIKLD